MAPGPLKAALQKCKGGRHGGCQWRTIKAGINPGSQQALQKAILQQQARGGALGVRPQLRRQRIDEVNPGGCGFDCAAWQVGKGAGKGRVVWGCQSKLHRRPAAGWEESMTAARAHWRHVHSQGGQCVADEAAQGGHRLVVIFGQACGVLQAPALPLALPPGEAHRRAGGQQGEAGQQAAQQEGEDGAAG